MTDRKTAATTNMSTRHVFETLRVITRSDTPLGLNEIAEFLDLPPSTAHRVLMTLEESGFAARVRQSARFVPGTTLHHLIRSMVAQYPIRAAAADTLRRLSGDFDVTTSLNWRVGWSSMRLASFDGLQESFQMRRIGELRPLHDGIGPSAILLALPRQERDRYVDRCHILSSTADDSVNLERIADYEHQMADKGYLELPPAHKLGFYWISAPIRRFDGEVGGSVSVGFSMNQRTGADLTLDIERVQEVLGELQDFLDADSSRTRSYFDGMDPDDFGIASSPSRSRVSI